MDNHARLREAYRAWVKARKEYEDAMDKFLKGDETVRAQFPALLASFDRTFKEFNVAAAPLMTWKGVSR